MDQTANPAPGFKRNPGHSITVVPYDGAVTVRSGGRVLAESKSAKLLREGSYPAVLYIPFADIDFAALEPSDTSSHCPYKGDASYWSERGGARDVMWAYERPYDEMSAIAGHGAFYQSKVEIEAGTA